MEDRFNKGMSCNTHFVFLHAISRRSHILSTFSRHQMMYNVSYLVLCAKFICKGYFLRQQQRKQQNQTPRPLITSSIVSYLCFIPELAPIMFFLNLSTLLCYNDLEINRCWRLRKMGWYKAFTKIGSWEHDIIMGIE